MVFYIYIYIDMEKENQDKLFNLNFSCSLRMRD